MAKHEETYVDFDKPYESNIIGLRGIIYFAVGLFLLIVVTFGLMWFLQNVMEQEALKTKSSDNPMQMSKEEALPPEPRLQAAPGFGVDSPNGRVSLELKPPQSEYRELQKQWKNLWENGQKAVDKNGNETVVTLPMNEAKDKLLQQSAGAQKSESEDNTFMQSRTLVSDASAGRTSTVKIR
jgi:hypothetical protein